MSSDFEEVPDGAGQVVVEHLDDGSWTRFPATPLHASPRVRWTGERLVSAGPGFGGVALDPQSGTWTALPRVPNDVAREPNKYGWSVAPTSDGPRVGTPYVVYDETADEWTVVSRPKGAAPWGWLA